MKQFIVMIGLLVCMSIGQGQAVADQNSGSVYAQTLSKVAGSVLQVTTSDYSAIPVPPFESTRKLGTGTGFVVFQSDKKTVILTAKHVVEMSEHADGVLRYTVEYNGTTYRSTLCEMSPDMDAAYLVFMPAIPGVKSLSMNLSDDDSVVEALCYGFGQSNHIKGQKQEYTFTHGFVSRKVCPRMVFGAENKLNTNLIYGTPTLIFGYSGGPMMDLDNRILGINIAMIGQSNVFVDIRAVYNWMKATLGKTAHAKVPIDQAFEVFNRAGKSRIPLVDEKVDSIETQYGRITFAELRMLLIIEASKEIRRVGPFIARSALDKQSYRWAQFEALVVIGDKHYKIRRALVAATPVVPFQYVNDFAGDDNRYMYMCGQGYELIIGLVEITDPKEVKERRATHAAQIKRRLAEEAAKIAKEKAELEARKQAAIKIALEKAKKAKK